MSPVRVVRKCRGVLGWLLLSGKVASKLKPLVVTRISLMANSWLRNNASQFSDGLGLVKLAGAPERFVFQARTNSPPNMYGCGFQGGALSTDTSKSPATSLYAKKPSSPAPDQLEFVVCSVSSPG